MDQKNGNDNRADGLELAKRLNAHPILKARMVGLLNLVENVKEVALADEAERRVVESLRSMGNELLTDWAQARAAQMDQEEQAAGVANMPKKTPMAQHVRIDSD